MVTTFNNLQTPQTNNDVISWLKSQGLTPINVCVDPNTGKVLLLTVQETLSGIQTTAIQTKYPELASVAPNATSV